MSSTHNTFSSMSFRLAANTVVVVMVVLVDQVFLNLVLHLSESFPTVLHITFPVVFPRWCSASLEFGNSTCKREISSPSSDASWNSSSESISESVSLSPS
ncbi:hypothetical protein F5050DRAFT_1735691 [Lentinula boryana]|uniref:Uncharacterized protein n=1 Tax=Lentinula boryana TaxID=40481 RepID=A0ABQ8QMQ6_9AGAR|nr:hypothetical protein F5050DRAFT_1735691 [Lentinula boryana]